MIDSPLATLFLPFNGHLPWPEEDALFLRARAGAPLAPYATRVLCEQTFKPAADALVRMGCNTAELAERKFPLVLVLPPRQRDELRALLARAITLVATGGRVVASAANDEGARSIEADLERLTGHVTTLSKNKCRVFWTDPLVSNASDALLNEWLALDAVRPIAEGRFLSRPGLFAWDRIDPASALLAAHLPSTLKGRAADLGAGFGFLSAELLKTCAGIRALDVYEAEQRALELCRSNLAAYASVPIAYHWSDVASGLSERYDVIVTNPPFHAQSGTDRPNIGRRFIAVAAAALRPGGRLWLVANRHLPYESELGEKFGTVRIVAQQQGFKVVEAIKAEHKHR